MLATFLIRAIHAGQPIVENYVGRQVPTAMVARNLERGSGFFRPQLDTAPFPNYFVVEPPLYESGVVVAAPADRTELGSRRANPLGALDDAWPPGGSSSWHGAAKAASGALLAVLAFAVFPLTIRYGRAFQPDASMLGAVVAGLACWDRYRCRPGAGTGSLAGWCLLALGFALKITSAFLLVPLVFMIVRARGRMAACSWRARRSLPALLWYVVGRII